MRTILFLIEKEFKQILRSKAMLPIIFIMPIIQLLVLANAATFEIKNLNIVLVDNDHSSISRNLINKFTASIYFKNMGIADNAKLAEKMVLERKADLYISIPSHFEKDLFRENNAKIQISANAIDGSKGTIAGFYSQSIINDYNKDLINKYSSKIVLSGIPVQPKLINITFQNWFNPLLNYKTYMVPGLLVLLVSIVGMFLSGMNIVREKELGTLESMNVTPIKKYQFIIGKLFPVWLIGIFELIFGLIVGLLIYNIPLIGNVFVLFSFAAIYLLVILGLGLFISTITDTQQQAMFFTWFFMVVFILLGGLFTAIENMPHWAQTLTLLNPIRYFIEVIRMIMLKGSGFVDLKNHFIVISIMAILINSLAILRYRKTE